MEANSVITAILGILAFIFSMGAIATAIRLGTNASQALPYALPIGILCIVAGLMLSPIKKLFFKEASFDTRQAISLACHATGIIAICLGTLVLLP